MFVSSNHGGENIGAFRCLPFLLFLGAHSSSFLAHYAVDKCALSVDHFCLMFSLFGMPQSTHSFVRMVGLLIGMFDSLACLAHE